MTPDDNTILEDRRASSAPSESLADHLFLVVEGARPHAGGMRCDLTGVTEIAFVRGEERAIVRERRGDGERLTVRVPDRRMSSNHARLVRTASGFQLEDTGSKNGSLLDGTPAKRAQVEDGSLIELGRTFFVFRQGLRTPSGILRDFDASAPDEAGALLAEVNSLLPAHRSQLEKLTRLAQADVPILLLGETGAGKEVFANWIHRTSKRSGPMKAMNCGGIPHSLFPSTLFGQERGAFTGAEKKTGFFRDADRGTLLLDEIGDMPIESQATLLRVLQEGKVTPLGSTQAVSVDVRVIAATNLNLADRVADRAFRQDLLNRLNGSTHRLPALRDRREDIGMLIAKMASHLPNGEGLQFTGPACRALLRHDWLIGNVRELYNVLEHALILSGGSPIEPEHLPVELAACANNEAAEEPRQELSEPEQILRTELEAHLVAHHGNVSKVAEAMGKHRMQIQRWMKRFSLDPARYRGN